MERSENGGGDSSPGRDDSILAHRVATMHFRDRLPNLEIARRLGISRFRVARLLDHSLDAGTVDIRIDLPSPVDDGLSARVRDLGLTDAAVLADDGDAAGRGTGVAALALRHVSGLLSDGDRLAIAWGRTLDALATTASRLLVHLPRADVVQLVGGIPSATGGLEASDLVRRFALLTGGRGIVLNAPLVVPTAAIAAGLRGERSVAETLEAAATATAALFGVGSWGRTPSHLAELLSDTDRASITATDVVGDVCGVMVASDGRVVTGGVSDRIVGIGAEGLRRIPRRIAVVIGPDKSAAVLAVLRAGLVTDLVLDGTAARELLADTGSAGLSG